MSIKGIELKVQLKHKTESEKDKLSGECLDYINKLERDKYNLIMENHRLQQELFKERIKQK